MIGDALGTSMFPAMSDLHQKKENFQSLIHNGLEIMLLVSVPISLGAMFVSGDIIGLVLGDSYAQSAVIFAIFAFALPFKFTGSIFCYLLMSVKKQSLVSKIILVAGLINFVLNWFLISSLGVQGAAIATLTVSIFTTLTFNFFVQQILPVSYGLRRILSILPPSLLLLGFLYFSESWHLHFLEITGNFIDQKLHYWEFWQSYFSESWRLNFLEVGHLVFRIGTGAAIYLVSAAFTSSVMRKTFLKFYNKAFPTR
jgi:O-antigen/teichoic acid export membrane protein